MGTILASAIITTRIRPTIHDEDADRFSDATLLAYLNDGQRFCVMLKPDLNVINTSWQLAAGTVQTIPTGGIELIDIVCNMGTSGTTQGNAIRLIDREALDLLKPAWRTDTASATALMWMFDEKDPTHFEVYPKQPTSSMGYVQGIYSVTPTDIASIGSAITLSDITEGILTNYVLFRIYATETDAFATQQATAYYNLCVTELERKDMIMKTYDPNRAKGVM